MSADKPPVICWLRRDLRLEDNLALQGALQSEQPVIILFILDPALVDQPPIFGLPRLKFMLAALHSLDQRLRAYDRCLLVQQGEPIRVLKALIETTRATDLFFNVDYTPYARTRDEKIEPEIGIPCHTFHDRLLVAPEEISSTGDKPFTVYTPFKNKWREYPKRISEPQHYALSSHRLYDAGVGHLHNFGVPDLKELGAANTIDIPEASPHAATKRLRMFAENKIYKYNEMRDHLANPFGDPHNGTSSLSPYIRFGLISPRQIRAAAAEAYQTAPSEHAIESVNKWVDEMIWHEFYTHILWHFPHAAHGNFNRKYDAVQWRRAPDELERWKAGQTGYPVVDAAMRQLKATGWMHNRARMIVASFLTKDLLIDWREGERYFMDLLLDGDIAANNGGWQWTAGTGTDAQPYFRIFNPVLQSKKADPDGIFIRQWLPELADVPTKYIHEPWKMDSPPRHYPPPMVDHVEARERTLAAYAVIKTDKE